MPRELLNSPLFGLASLLLAARALGSPEPPPLHVTCLYSALALATNVATVAAAGAQLEFTNGWRVSLFCAGAQLLFLWYAGAWGAAAAALCANTLYIAGVTDAALAMLIWPVTVSVTAPVVRWVCVFPAGAPVLCLCIGLGAVHSCDWDPFWAHCNYVLSSVLRAAAEAMGAAAVPPPSRHAPPPAIAGAVLAPPWFVDRDTPLLRRFVARDVVTLSTGYSSYSDAAQGPLQPRVLGLITIVQMRVKVERLEVEAGQLVWAYAEHELQRHPNARRLAVGDVVRLADGLAESLRLGPLRPNDIGVVVDASDGRPRVISVRRLCTVADQPWWYDHGALALVLAARVSAAEAARPAAAAASPLRYAQGTFVRLSACYASHSDAADGPLSTGDVGLVCEHSVARVHVKPLRLRSRDVGAPYAPAMLRRATPTSTDLPLAVNDLVYAAPGVEAYSELQREGLSANTVGVIVAVAAEGTLTVRRLRPRGDGWWYDVGALQAASSLAVQAALAQAEATRVASAPPPFRLGQLVCLSSAGAMQLEEHDRDGDSDDEGAQEDVNCRLRRGEIGVVSRVLRGAVPTVDVRRLGTERSYRYTCFELAPAPADVASEVRQPLAPGDRVVRRCGYRGPLPAATRGPRLERGHVGVVAGLSGADAAARVLVTAHGGSTLAYRPEALERAPAARARRTPTPHNAPPSLTVQLRAGVHGHPIGARAATFPFMARYHARCDLCHSWTEQSTSARCTLGCYFDLCAGCLAAELRREAGRFVGENDAALSAAELIAAAASEQAKQGGEACSLAAAAAPFLALHEHPLAGLADAALWPRMRRWRRMRDEWGCDVCRRRFSGSDERHRCTAGCDWDACDQCATGAMLGLTAPPLSAGDRVSLAEGYACYGDAADGPLRPGDVGIVARVRPNNVLSVLVRPPGSHVGSQGWWYFRAALDAAPGDAEGAVQDAEQPSPAVPAQELPAQELPAEVATADSASHPLGAADSAESSASGRNAWDFFARPAAGAAFGDHPGGDEVFPAARAAALRRRIVACALYGAQPLDEELEAAGQRMAATAADGDEEIEDDGDDDEDDKDEDEGLSEPLCLCVARDDVVRTSMDFLGAPGEETWLRPLRVSFTATAGAEEEPGVDGGGLSREWYACTARALMHIPAIVPTANGNGEYYFNPAACSASDLAACAFLGAFMGRALVEGSARARVARLGHVTLGGMRLCDAFYKVLLGVPLTLADVADVSAPDARALQALLDAPRPEELCLGAFVHEVFAPGGRGGAAPCAVLPLRPGGANVPITRRNRHEFALLKTQSLLMTSVAKQLDAACAGFFAIVPAAVLRGSGVTPRQLRRLLCGGGDGFDVAGLRAHTHYRAPYSSADRVIAWLWQVLAEGGAEMQADFLEFTTGCPTPPADGFAALAAALPAGRYPLTIQQVPLHASPAAAGGAAPPPRLPEAHTCVCSLELPPYDSKEVLRERLLQALVYKNSYGFG